VEFAVISENFVSVHFKTKYFLHSILIFSVFEILGS
jgi:hypothetical protein